MQESTMIKSSTCHNASSGLRRGTWTAVDDNLLKKCMKSSSGIELRRGAWTAEEDNLLRKCIEKHGEGNWHQVPARAGLNRCRKSCRLRWLNYLKPNIKRGEFTVDEVDLIIRLHKLLGNRWSLIAGRIPGRTANDVKNYWNTHIHKKQVPAKTNGSKSINKSSSTVIKPRPFIFISNKISLPVSNENKNTASVKINNLMMNFKPSPENGSTTYTHDDQLRSGNMLVKTREMIGNCSSSDDNTQFMTGELWFDQINFNENEADGTIFFQDSGQIDDFDDLAIDDLDLWDILN